jgi:hypothetical protein
VVKFSPALVLSFALVGCASPTIYSWGHYEDQVYTSYAKPGAVPPEQQIEKLEQDYQQARSAQKPVPPGWHAQLGYLYYAVGKQDQARQEFETEKATFPESAVFMNRLLTKLAKS